MPRLFGFPNAAAGQLSTFTQSGLFVFMLNCMFRWHDDLSMNDTRWTNQVLCHCENTWQGMRSVLSFLCVQSSILFSAMYSLSLDCSFSMRLWSYVSSSSNGCRQAATLNVHSTEIPVFWRIVGVSGAWKSQNTKMPICSILYDH